MLEEETYIEEINDKNKDKLINNGLINNNKNDKNIMIAHFYRVDRALRKIIALKEENGILYALVEIIGNKGKIKKKKIEANSLKINNPWILIDFYESRAKFG